jgi:uncharacterized membrane protein
MSFCQNCGRSLPENNAVCQICSSPRARAAAVASAPAPAASGLQPYTAAALAYLAGFVSGIHFLVVEPFKADRFVRFHAFQSIFFNIAWTGLWFTWIIVGLVLGAITKGLFFLIQMPIDILMMVGGFCLWAFLMFNASQGKAFKLPVIGAIAAKQAGLQL